MGLTGQTHYESTPYHPPIAAGVLKFTCYVYFVLNEVDALGATPAPPQTASAAEDGKNP